MDTIALLRNLGIVWLACVVVSWAYSNAHQPSAAGASKITREYPALCVDPFTSRDMGERRWTWCKLVPMWSMKV